jgi:hypothetical protein
MQSVYLCLYGGGAEKEGKGVHDVVMLLERGRLVVAERKWIGERE